jgi:hypothetical protein
MPLKKSSNLTRKSGGREEEEKADSCTDANNAALVTSNAHTFDGDEQIVERVGHLRTGMHNAEQRYSLKFHDMN